jgi:transcriptional regulator with XRE-family HTH domain
VTVPPPYEHRAELVPANFGRNLRRIRHARNLTVPELARLTGLSKDGLHKYENGLRNARLDFVQRLVDGLRVEPGEFFRLEPAGLLPGLHVEVPDVPVRNVRPISQAHVATNFGKNVRKLRVGKGWTQEQLGRRHGIDRAGIVRIEAGKAIPRITTVVQMANALTVDPAALLVRNDKPLAPGLSATPTTQKDVLAFIEANPGSEVPEIAAALGRTTPSINMALGRLRRDGKVMWGTPIFLMDPALLD